MRVSIIVPYYNYPQYLEDCLLSIEEQQLHDFETIVISNRKEEEISSIIKRFKDTTTLTCIYSEEEASVAYNRNLGLEKATGEYIYFLDSDDYLLPDTLKLLLDEAESKNLDVTCGLRKLTWFKKSVFEAMAFEKNEEDNKAMKNSDKENAFLEEVYGDSEEEHQRRATDVLIRTRRGMKNISVLHILMRRSIIEKNNIRFREQFLYYSDVSFIVQLLTYVTSFNRIDESIYVKRRHNDPINMPAVSQIVDPNRRFDEYVTAYYYSATLIEEDSIIRYALDKKIVSYYCRDFSKKIRRSLDECWRNERFTMMALVLRNVRKDIISSLHGYRKRLVKATLEEDLPKVKRVINQQLVKQKLKKMIKNKKEIYKYLYRHQYVKQPVENTWVMFECFRGQSYADSPKYIYEYLSKQYPDTYTCIWVVNDLHTPLPYPGIKVKRFSRKYAYYLAKSKYLVFNVRQPLWFRKREEQVFLQTWHGTPLKRLVFDQEEVTAASPTYKKQFYRQKQEWDYLIAANHFSSEIFKSCFMYDGNMLEVGYPRNDLLYAENKDDIATSIRKKLGIPLDKKTILYAPTWRDDEYYGKGQYKFQLQLDLNLLRERLGDEYVILLRTHYYIADKLDLEGVEDFAYNVSNHDDITEIYLISDICITDYSSVFFDYANLKRPILFFPYDLDKYRDVLRGFYIDMEKELPGPLLFTTEEITTSIENIEKVNAEYQERYLEFYQRFCSLEDGKASARVVETVFK
ncbi:MAG: CDP-glycerol:glycerophosphate glycerophosphotransferase [Coprobacillaceae bacterium]